MSFLKTVFRISLQNLRKWRTDYRIWTIAAALIVVTLIYTDDLHNIAEAVGLEMSVWIFPFLYTNYYYKLIFTFALALILCNAPFIDKNQLFVMMRSSRTRWLCGQILYIILASAIYYLFIFAITVLSTVFYGDISSDWGSVITAMAYDPLIKPTEMTNVYITFSKIVVDYFTPPLACFYTFLMSWLVGIFLGLVIFVFNLFTNSKTLGAAASGALIVMTLFADGYYGVNRFSPVSWATLDKIDVGGLTVHPSFTYCLTVLLLLIAALTAAVLLFGKHKSFDTKGE